MSSIQRNQYRRLVVFKGSSRVIFDVKKSFIIHLFRRHVVGTGDRKKKYYRVLWYVFAGFRWSTFTMVLRWWLVVTRKTPIHKRKIINQICYMFCGLWWLEGEGGSSQVVLRTLLHWKKTKSVKQKTVK